MQTDGATKSKLRTKMINNLLSQVMFMILQKVVTPSRNVCPAYPVSEPTKRPTTLMISGTLPPSLTRFVVGFDGTFHSKHIS